MRSESSIEKSDWRVLLEAYLRSRVVSADNPNLQRWLWQSPEYETQHTDNAIKLLSHSFKDLAEVRIVDFGSGGGLDAINLAKEGAVVTGVEIDPELRTIAQARSDEANVNVRYVRDCETMSRVENGQYDALVSLDVIEHVEDWETVFQSAISLVRTGGAIVISTPNRWAISNIIADPHWKLFGVTLMPRWFAQWYVCKVRQAVKHYDVWNFVTHRQLVKCLQLSGCRVIYDSLQEYEEKLNSPSSIRQPSLRKMVTILSGLWRYRTLRDVVARIYCLGFNRSWWLMAERVE